MFDGRCNRFENVLPVDHDLVIVEAQKPLYPLPTPPPQAGEGADRAWRLH